MYLRSEQHQARLPVLILTGFLGSGKTTLLNRLLKDARLAETAVAINEFGEAPLDAHLIEHGAEQTIVMANGCLCCNVLGEMEDAVMRIFSRAQSGALPSFRRLIIEPSGLADPAPIAQAILRNPVLSRAFRLEGIIATADAVFATRQIAEHPETAKQIAMADKIIVTKSDMTTSEGLPALLRAHNPVAEILFAEHGHIDPLAVLPESFVNHNAPSRGWHATLTAESAGHITETRAISLTTETPLNWQTFEPWLRKIRLTHATNLLRIKAILNLEGNPVAIHGIHHVLHAPLALPAWPDNDHRSRIVFITRGLAANVIENAWADYAPTQALAA
jgi:G3E family GTPase